MAVVTVTVKATGGFQSKVRAIAEEMRAPMRGQLGQEVVKAMRRVVNQEFSQGGGFRINGGIQRWRKSKPFGNRPAPSTPLGGTSGSIARAWAGGEGGFSNVIEGGTGVEIGVSGHPKFRVHRGGNESINAGGVTVIRPKSGDKMRYKLGLSFGVWISRARLERGLQIPTRPHAQASLRLSEEVKKVVAKRLKELIA